MEKVERFYDEEYDEWPRLERHRIEFDITKRYLDEYLVGTSLKVFDIGGGPGRYAIYLAGKGHQVTLLDLSKRHILIAMEEAAKQGVELEACIHGNALELADYDRDYDAVLLMGPLYHLTDLKDRQKAIEEALLRLRPGGLIFAAFISGYAPVHDNLKYLYELDSPEGVLAYISGAPNPPDSGFTTSYFCSPQEARDLMAGFGLKELAFAAVENILCTKEQEINALPEEQYQNWLEVCYQLGRDPNLWGAGEHLLYIGEK